MITGKTASQAVIGQRMEILVRSLKMMEVWLTNNKFLCGSEISIADLCAAHELDQTKFIAFDLSPYPKVKAWLHHVIDESPEGMEVSKVMRKLAAVSAAQQTKVADPKL